MDDGTRHRTKNGYNTLLVYQREGKETLPGVPIPNNENFFCIQIIGQHWEG